MAIKNYDGEGSWCAHESAKFNRGDNEDPKSLIDMGDMPVDMSKPIKATDEYGWEYERRPDLEFNEISDGSLEEGVTCQERMYDDPIRKTTNNY